MPTKSALEGAPDELSLYAVESYWTDDSSALRRYTLRTDGFVSVHAPMSGGELVSQPFTFAGKRLSLNFSSSAAGGLRVELQTPDGKPIPGFSLDESAEIFGDSLDRTVTWKSPRSVGELAGQPVRMRMDKRDRGVHIYRRNKQKSHAVHRLQLFEQLLNKGRVAVIVNVPIDDLGLDELGP